jgi:ribulose-phosphate 3-epimerase
MIIYIRQRGEDEMKTYVIPSLIAKSQDELTDRIKKVKDVAELFQLDVMDGEFVPNTSLDFEIEVDDELEYEAHLMITDPIPWIENNLDKAGTFLIHWEAFQDINELLKFQEKGKRVGIALNPETGLSEIEDYIDKVDEILIMTVHPGFYGAEFLPEMLAKVRELRKLHPGLDIEVDGGMKYDTIKLAYEAGANKFVSGSYLMKADNVKNVMDEIVTYLGND